MISLKQGDAFELIKEIQDKSIDLIVTSPPYAMRREKQYGGIPAENYPEWFMVLATQAKRVLKDTGSFVLNIKEHRENFSRSMYVYKTVIAMVDDGWFLLDDMIWVKTNGIPGRWAQRLSDAWEHLYHFALTPHIQFYPDNCTVPVSEATIKRLQQKKVLTQTERQYASTTSGYSVVMQKFLDENNKPRKERLPTNILYAGTETHASIKLPDGTMYHHSAPFPKQIPHFFISLLTKENDTVLDPFGGSGTTAIVAEQLGRNSILFELQQTSIEHAILRLKKHGIDMNTQRLF